MSHTTKRIDALAAELRRECPLRELWSAVQRTDGLPTTAAYRHSIHLSQAAAYDEIDRCYAHGILAPGQSFQVIPWRGKWAVLFYT